MVGAQIDDSNIKYYKAHWYIVYPTAKEIETDILQTLLTSEKAKYELKSEDPIIQEKTNVVQLSGTLTFKNQHDGLLYYSKMLSSITFNDVIYAKFDLTNNTHHWSDDRVLPDEILAQLIQGDTSQFEILGIR